MEKEQGFYFNCLNPLFDEAPKSWSDYFKDIKALYYLFKLYVEWLHKDDFSGMREVEEIKDKTDKIKDFLDRPESCSLAVAYFKAHMAQGPTDASGDRFYSNFMLLHSSSEGLFQFREEFKSKTKLRNSDDFSSILVSLRIISDMIEEIQNRKKI